MKYLITESQIDNVIFKYLDNQDFIQMNFDEKIYFVNSVNNVYAQIKYDKAGLCFINSELVDEISSFFSMEESDSKQVIGRWVENRLQMKVTNTDWRNNSKWFALRLPYYN